MIADWQYINDIGDAGGWKADDNQFVAVHQQLGRHRRQVVVDTPST